MYNHFHQHFGDRRQLEVTKVNALAVGLLYVLLVGRVGNVRNLKQIIAVLHILEHEMPVGTRNCIFEQGGV